VSDEKDNCAECGEVAYLNDNDLCDDCQREQDENATCPTCSGSGEGIHDGSRCRTCGGSGNNKRAWGKRRLGESED
jgi:DnaJ-class molecular chaperone